MYANTIRQLLRAFGLLIILIVCTASVLSAQQPSVNIPDITGSWERARDPSIPNQSQPPLKPQYLKEWQAQAPAAREASAKGQPIAQGVGLCLPEGMTGMMAGAVPVGIRQSKGEVR